MDERVVLLVEDNAATRQLVRAVLAADAIRVVEAPTVREAVPAALRSRPDLVLLDIGLPDGNGLDLLPALRAAVGPQVPILAFTGVVSSHDENRLATAGFDDIVAKPVDGARLRETLRAYLPDTSTPSERFGDGKVVVLADDDPVQRKLGALRLGKLGFRVVGAEDGESCLALVATERPDVVVSDVLMPGVDGFEVCSRLRSAASTHGVPIVLVTNSYLEDADRDLATRVGADAFVAKSADFRDVIDAVRGIVTRRRPHSAFTAPGEGPAAHHARLVRAAHQLDRQLALNAALTQRIAILSAQITILGGLTSALAENRNVDTALDSALHACLDAGGFSWGLLLVRQGDRWLRRSLGLGAEERRAIEESPALLIERMQLDPTRRTPIRVPGSMVGSDDGGDALVVPVIHRDDLLGAIVLRVGETLDEQRMVFVQVIAGQIALVLAMARTFQELETASHAERERANLLAATFQAIGEPMLVVDREGRPTRWNESGAEFRFLGTHGEGDPPSAPMMHGDQVTPYAAEELPIPRALAGVHVDDLELCVGGAEGPRWVRVTARPIEDDGGAPSGAVAVLRDVTEEKKTQAKQIVNDRLASIGVLAAGIAHEINNPMTAVLAEIEMAIDDLPRESPVAVRLTGALDAALRVRTIVADLRTLSRGGSSDERSPVDLSRALDTALRIALPQTRGVAVVSTEMSDMPYVLANEARMVQVFLNLVVNAAQAIPEHAPSGSHRIRITAGTAASGEAVVEVSDTGVGMTVEVKQRIFTPFFTTKPIGAGTGLGLSICQRIVADAGGTIECESTPGRGTTFTVRLPPGPRGVTAGRAGTGVHPRLARPRVLVVDPDPLGRQTIVRALDPDHEVTACSDAATAWARLARGESFDLALWDVAASVGQLTGAWECLTGSSVGGAALVTGRTLRDDVRAFLSTHDVPRLEKPFDAGRLRAFVAAQRERALDAAAPGETSS